MRSQAGGGLEADLGEFGAKLAKSIVENAPDLAGAIRYIARLDQPLFRNMLGDVALRLAPIFRRNPNIRGIGLNILIPALIASLTYSVYSAFATSQIPDQETSETPREGQGGTEASRGETTEFNKGEKVPVPQEEIDKPIGEPLLRPEFKMLGTDFFDDQFGRVPLDVENSEWAEFNYVNDFDRQNNIEIDNVLADQIRYSGDLFMPKFQARVKPPSRRAIIMTRDTLAPVLQLDQGFAGKFTRAVNPYENLTYINDDPFSRTFTANDQLLYRPDSSIM